MNVFLVLLLLTFAMSFRDVADAPSAKSPGEIRSAVRAAGWQRVALVTLWFVLTFACRNLESLGWVIWSLVTLTTWVFHRVGNGLANLGCSSALAATSPG